MYSLQAALGEYKLTRTFLRHSLPLKSVLSFKGELYRRCFAIRYMCSDFICLSWKKTMSWATGMKSSFRMLSDHICPSHRRPSSRPECPRFRDRCLDLTSRQALASLRARCNQRKHCRLGDLNYRISRQIHGGANNVTTVLHELDISILDPRFTAAAAN